MRRGIGLFALILLAAVPARAQPPAGMSAAQTLKRIISGIEKNDGQEVAAATELLAIMGAGLSEESQARIAPFLSAEQQGMLRERFAANVQPIEVSTIFAEIPVDYHLVEGIAHDPRTGRMFAGTVVDGRLLVTNGLGWRTIELPGGLGGLFGMQVDAERRRLWIANGVADEVKNRESIVPGILEVDLDTLTLLGHKAMPAGA